ncbi:MAG TPA: hydrogenase maturation protease [Candidatus Binataceae bacterium]|nr:hydrogenase maturation protease [Candidatus Binataceae bacterium]
MNRPRARIIGIGQDTAGDDGVGIAVARHLGTLEVPADIEIIERAEPSAAIDLLSDGIKQVVFIDALVDGAKTGRVVEIDPSQHNAADGRPLSTHGIGLLEAIELARTLDRSAMPQRITIVGITIERPSRYRAEVSAPVAAAIPIAAKLALGQLGIAR